MQASLDLMLPDRKKFRIGDLFRDVSEMSEQTEIEVSLLTEKARWIRDMLDPVVARDGPDELSADQVVTLFKLITRLRRSRISVESLRSSRIHLAVGTISGPATRWPGTLVEEADKLIENWTTRYGPLEEVGTDLYEAGGRLHGICTPEDLSKEMLEFRWLRAKDSKVVHGYSHRYGDLGFKPGE